MNRAFLVVSLASGCVLEIPYPGRGDIDAILEASPSVVEPGGRTRVSIWAAHGSFDVGAVRDIRPLGRLDVVEWTVAFDSIDVVLEVPHHADAEEILALDTPRATAFVSLYVEAPAEP